MAVRLDRRVYESARPDLADLRVVDEGGGLVPFLLDRGRESGAGGDLHPIIRNRAWLEDGSASAVLDFGGRFSRRGLTLGLSGRNFRRRVTVEGSDEQVRWKTIVADAWVFAVPASEPARYETLDLPENDFPFLRVTVHPGLDEDGRIAILDAHVPERGRPPLREERRAPRWTRVEDAADSETWLLLDLGARYQPFHAIELEVSDRRFFRELVVEARRERRSRVGAAGRLEWVAIGRGALYRLEHGGRWSERQGIAVCGRERALRVRLLNHDDRPLAVQGVFVRVPLERIVFEAAPGHAYLLRYGSGQARPASFDLSRTVRDVGAFAATASSGSLGSERVKRPPGRPRPWTERHPALLWAGLVAVVAALGALTYHALRETRPGT